MAVGAQSYEPQTSQLQFVVRGQAGSPGAGSAPTNPLTASRVTTLEWGQPQSVGFKTNRDTCPELRHVPCTLIVWQEHGQDQEMAHMPNAYMYLSVRL